MLKSHENINEKTKIQNGKMYDLINKPDKLNSLQIITIDHIVQLT